MAGKSPEDQHPVKTYGWAATDPSGILSPFKFSRRATGDEDIRFKVLYCGICRSDLQAIKNEFGNTRYPLVPGMEIVGIATEVGTKVTKVKVGDKVGVGSIVEDCINEREVYCPEFITTHGVMNDNETPTYGGFSNEMVANEKCVFLLPNNLPLPGIAPLLGAGITVYSAIKYYGLDKPGLHLGVVGLGGLGHLAVKIAKAFGAKVTVISTSSSKKDEALSVLGADAFVDSNNDEEMKAAFGTFNGLVDTVPVGHPVMPLLGLLKNHSKIVMLGASSTQFQLPIFPLTLGRKGVVSSVGGTLKEHQEFLDFAAKHNITANVEVIPIENVNTAMERLGKGDVRYRFVIDIGTTLTPPES